jgi:hypothetical protein
VFDPDLPLGHPGAQATPSRARHYPTGDAGTAGAAAPAIGEEVADVDAVFLTNAAVGHYAGIPPDLV